MSAKAYHENFIKNVTREMVEIKYHTKLLSMKDNETSN